MSKKTGPTLAWSGGRTEVEMVSAGGGDYASEFRLTEHGIRSVAKWLAERANIADIEDCEACALITNDYCPVHLGFVHGADAMRKHVAKAMEF